MRRFLHFLALDTLLLVSSSAFAQSAPPVQHFVISTASAGTSSTNGMQAVAVAGAGFQLTADVSVAYGRISNPTDSKKPIYNLGDLNYTRQLRALLGSKVSSKLVFDTTNWLVTFQASAGKVTGVGFNRIAEGGGLYLTRPVANNVAVTTGYRLLHGAGTSLIKVPTVGLNFTF